MKFIILSLAIGHFAFGVSLKGQSVVNAERMADDMDALVSKIRPLLPSDWIVEASPFDPESDLFDSYYGPGRAEIAVYKNTPVTFVPKNAVSVILKEDVFHLRYELTPKLSEDKWKKLSATNTMNNATRDKFKKALDGCRNRQKKASHYDPANYLPVTAEQKSLLKRYYFVWAATTIERLPDAWFGSVSVWIRDNSSYALSPKNLEIEYTKVSALIEGVLLAYDSTNKSKR
ncbi:MAG: hypothetical protein P1U89_12335 [Verrucomicrobiales bacterium]|nr:hypothetical protein [Verrucomicrobiales bacterium]